MSATTPVTQSEQSEYELAMRVMQPFFTEMSATDSQLQELQEKKSERYRTVIEHLIRDVTKLIEQSKRLKDERDTIHKEATEYKEALGKSNTNMRVANTNVHTLNAMNKSESAAHSKTKGELAEEKKKRVEAEKALAEADAKCARTKKTLVEAVSLVRKYSKMLDETGKGHSAEKADKALAEEKKKRVTADKALAEEKKKCIEVEKALAEEKKKCIEVEKALAEEQAKNKAHEERRAAKKAKKRKREGKVEEALARATGSIGSDGSTRRSKRLRKGCHD